MTVIAGNQENAVWRPPELDCIPKAGVTHEVADLMARAVLLEVEDDPNQEEEPLGSNLVALSAGYSPVSQWFRQYLKFSAININTIVHDQKKILPRINRVRGRRLSRDEIRSIVEEDIYWYTGFCVDWFQVAKDVVFKTSGDNNLPIDLRHVVGIYLYLPPKILKDSGRDQDVLLHWGFDQKDWSDSFITYIQDHFPEESPQWRQLHTDYFGEAPILPHRMTFISTSVGLLLSRSDNDNIIQLFSRMDQAVQNQDWSLVLHVSASIFETVAKLRVGTPGVQNQTLGSFFQAYRNCSLLPAQILDYIESIYKRRNTEPLAGHGSTSASTFTEREAMQARALTQLLVRLELDA
jgi:hypothetical protein